MKNWEALQSECIACRKCALAETRHNVVFGSGNPNAEVMFIGEGPGEQEDLKGEAFVGRAGKLLDDMLEIIDWTGAKSISPTWSSAVRPRTGTPSTWSRRPASTICATR